VSKAANKNKPIFCNVTFVSNMCQVYSTKEKHACNFHCQTNARKNFLKKGAKVGSLLFSLSFSLFCMPCQEEQCNYGTNKEWTTGRGMGGVGWNEHEFQPPPLGTWSFFSSLLSPSTNVGLHARSQVWNKGARGFNLEFPFFLFNFFVIFQIGKASWYITKNHVCRNHSTLQFKFKKQLTYNYCATLSWVWQIVCNYPLKNMMY